MTGGVVLSRPRSLSSARRGELPSRKAGIVRHIAFTLVKICRVDITEPVMAPAITHGSRKAR
jgi:hypothetical protein